MDMYQLKKKLDEINQMLETGRELMNEDPILEFQSASQEIVAKMQDIMQEGRQLRLGIVGEVKAGKSSFLNALLFEGKDILPKAPTPMTAALTKISYSDSPKAKIVFYDTNDWKAVRDHAEKYDAVLQEMYERYKEQIKKEHRSEGGPFSRKKSQQPPEQEMPLEEFERINRSQIPEEYRACREVLDMAKKNQLQVQQYLGTEEIIEGSIDQDVYFNRLDEYVGSEGKLTPIVKYTEIQLCHPMLQGVEVIDTPGLNDPILSRSRTTQKFLIACDAVFLLGYGGQFLGADDMRFLMSSLPNEGIQKAVLICSKIDSAILQYPFKRGQTPSFKKAYLGTIRNCGEQAKENLEECTATAHNGKLLKQVKDSLPPKCISSLAYTAALQMERGEALGPHEKKMQDNFCQRFPDFTNCADTFMGLSNIPDVKNEVFEETKKQKDQIIQERIRNLVQSQITRFLGSLEEIAVQAKSNQNDLKKYDCGQLEEKLDKLKEKLDSVRIIVKNLFERAAIDSKRQIEDIALDIGIEMGNHMDIEVISSTKREHRSSTSGHLWWKKTNHWDEMIHTNTVEVKDVDENIRNYSLSCMQIVNTSFRNILKINELRDHVKATVMGAFEQSDQDFDENKILIPLENALSRISMPSLEVELEEYETMLDGLLSGIVSNGTVKNDNIPLLKRAQDKVLAKMSKDIVQKIRAKGDEMDHNLQTQAAVFVDRIVEQLSENQRKLEVLIEDKQSNLEKFDTFLKGLSVAKNGLRTLGA